MREANNKNKVIVLITIAAVAIVAAALMVISGGVGSYKVSFETYGGYGIEENMSVRGGSLIDVPNAPRREHYTFEGWYKEPELINEWNFSKDKISGDTVLYSKWTPVIYTVSFFDGAVAYAGVQNITYPGLVSEPSQPSKSGYAFDGWYNGAEKWDFYADIVKSDTVLSAVWIAEIFNVKYIAEGNEYASDNVAYMERLKAPVPPAKTGYDFIGWRDTAGITWDFNDGYSFTYDMEFYATFAAKSFEVEFELNGAVYDTKTVIYGEKLVRPVEPAQTPGYTFGWYYEDGSEYDFNAPYSGLDDTKLIGAYKINKYAVRFNVNGTVFYEKTADYGEYAARPELIPTVAGYMFKGWYTDETYKTAFDFENTAIYADVDIYAYLVKDVEDDGTINNWEKFFSDNNIDAGARGHALDLIERAEDKITNPVVQGFIKDFTLSINGDNEILQNAKFSVALGLFDVLLSTL
ncbi:MAG: InlB B-repeat-containing protein [Clostridiales bacterium]|jgi:uncharacterized repeat protein (TIGR02543 family)|nr:InlB B-repeat-containing protein [Clostridiales bacterium]